jgi:signal transduction histidine kinase
VYTIKDNGIGIAEEDQQHMFRIFHRMSNSKGFNGNGVGLSIVYRIMNRLGGSISFDSVEEQGTSFHLIFKKPPVKV